MERSEHYRKPVALPLISIRLSRYSSFSFALLVCSMILVMGIMSAVRREALNPFSAFLDLQGDEARQAALRRGFSCESAGANQRVITESCAQRNPDEPFLVIFMRLAGNGMNEMTFLLRAYTFRLGDLALLWGNPVTTMYCETLVASWPANHITSIISPTRTGQVSYFSPVSSVSFSYGDLPHYPRLLMHEALHDCQ